jgi:hypothetical protein
MVMGKHPCIYKKLVPALYCPSPKTCSLALNQLVIPPWKQVLKLNFKSKSQRLLQEADAARHLCRRCHAKGGGGSIVI